MFHKFTNAIFHILFNIFDRMGKDGMGSYFDGSILSLFLCALSGTQLASSSRTLELSSYLLKFPNDAYTTLSQFRLAVEHSVKSTAS